MRPAGLLLALLGACTVPPSAPTSPDSDPRAPDDADTDDHSGVVPRDSDPPDAPDSDVPDGDAPDGEPPADTDTDAPGPFELCAWLAANPPDPSDPSARYEYACLDAVTPDCGHALFVHTTADLLARGFALQAVAAPLPSCELRAGEGCLDVWGTPREGLYCTPAP